MATSRTQRDKSLTKEQRRLIEIASGGRYGQDHNLIPLPIVDNLFRWYCGYREMEREHPVPALPKIKKELAEIRTFAQGLLSRLSPGSIMLRVIPLAAPDTWRRKTWLHDLRVPLLELIEAAERAEDRIPKEGGPGRRVDHIRFALAWRVYRAMEDAGLKPVLTLDGQYERILNAMLNLANEQLSEDTVHKLARAAVRRGRQGLVRL